MRTRLVLTQAELAERVGVTPNTLARWERGEIPVSRIAAKTIEAIGAGTLTGSAISRGSGFTLDPLHREILSALDGPVNPSGFEACAVELIREEGWRAVPVSGGQDAGFDGAIADGAGEPLMLIVTTSTNLVSNLKGNVKSARRNGWQANEAIFATSRHIAGKMRRRLFDAAETLNISLIQTYDQDWFAYRLYANPVWCKQLLNISGRPHALSAFPRTKRPVRGDELLGRERELQWLIDRTGDSVLVGGPAVGKTFLLRSLVQEGQVLFLVDDDREKIANDLRELQPQAVIIDDAHVRIKLVESFLELRKSVAAESVAVIATCWPGAVSEVQGALGVASDAVCEINQISDGKIMIELIKSCGLQGPDELLAEIRRQAGGRPGLAATLAHLCVAGDFSRVVTGEALLDHLIPSLDLMLGTDTRFYLAPFALGGEAGSMPNAVASRLRVSDLDISSKLAQLAEAGIVMERPGRAVSVQPAQLRWALVRDVFFGGAGSLDYLTFLEIVENRYEGLKTLIGARSRGAQISDLASQIEDMPSVGLWQDFARCGRNEVEYVLDNHPDLLTDVASSALEHSPEATIPRLLDNAKSGVFDRSFNQQGPIEELRRWVSTGLPLNASAQEVLRRRTTFVQQSTIWWKRTRNSRVAISAMAIALDPEVEHSSLDPGNEDTLTIMRGVYALPVIKGLISLWPALIEVASTGDDVPWTDLMQLATEWFFVDRFHAVDRDTLTAAQSFAQQILEDIAKATQYRPGVQHLLKNYAARLDLTIELELDEDFEFLFPDWRVDIDEMGILADRFKNRWVGSSADDLSGRLTQIDSQADWAGIQVTSLVLGIACDRIARVHQDPLSVASHLIENDVSAPIVEPFLQFAASRGVSGWVTLAGKCLESEKYRPIAIAVIIRNLDSPSDLLGAAISNAGPYSGVVELWCLRGEVDESVLDKLLGANDDRIATAAAIGHWCADPQGEIAIAVKGAWRDAILRSVNDGLGHTNGRNYWLGQMLCKDGNLAKDFLILELGQIDRNWLGLAGEDVAIEAIGGMDVRLRQEVLRELPTGRIWPPKDIAKLLIGDELGLYKELLSSDALREYHLAPLAGKPDREWGAKAKLALDAGHRAVDIVAATQSSPFSWMGNESEMWAEWRSAFELVGKLNDDDPRIVDLARRGQSMMLTRETQAQVEERRRALYGR